MRRAPVRLFVFRLQISSTRSVSLMIETSLIKSTPQPRVGSVRLRHYSFTEFSDTYSPTLVRLASTRQLGLAESVEGAHWAVYTSMSKSLSRRARSMASMLSLTGLVMSPHLTFVVPSSSRIAASLVLTNSGRCDDHAIVATKLQDTAPEAGRDDLRHGAPHGHGTGGRDHRNMPVVVKASPFLQS